jgi:hypothetical protein
MQRFLLLYSGPPTPPTATHERWPAWFNKVGGALVDIGSPMANGVVLHPDGSTSGDADPLRGYSLIEAESRDEALELLRDHPLLAAGPDYRIQLFEVPKK